MGHGRYADGRTYELPVGWDPVATDVLDLAVQQARFALGCHLLEPEVVSARLDRYFDPERDYAGTLFSALQPSAPADVDAVDLLAVTTLSMRLPALLVRQLLEPNSQKRLRVLRLLRSIPDTVPLKELGSGGTDAPAILTALEELQRELLKIPKESSDRWVFAAKLSARKRPLLLPVRDNVVCKYLSDSHDIGNPGGLGTFRADIQVFGFLMSDPKLVDEINHQWDRLRGKYGPRFEPVPPMRILDVALRQTGKAAGFSERPRGVRQP